MGFVPQRAGDENGCPLRNSRNFHLALPASVGVHGTEGSGIYKMVSLHNLCCIPYPFPRIGLRVMFILQKLLRKFVTVSYCSLHIF